MRSTHPARRYPSILKPLALALAIGLPASASAQPADFPNGVPKELIAVFTGGIVTQGLPAGFPALNLPPGISVVGAIDRGVDKMVVFSTTDDLNQAAAALHASVQQSGWQELPMPGTPERDVGFVMPAGAGAAQQPARLAQLCNDGAGIFNINSIPESGTWFTASLQQLVGRDPAFSCDAQRQQRMNSMARRADRDPNGLYDFIPRLELPPPSATAVQGLNVGVGGRFFGGGGISSSTDETSFQGRAITDFDLPRLLEHFGTQLEAQGWTRDATGSGSLSAQSSWTRAGQRGQQLVGLLEIVKQRDENYRLYFRLTALLPSPANPTQVLGGNAIR